MQLEVNIYQNICIFLLVTIIIFCPISGMISPEEMEFLAEFGVLTIIPNFQQEQLYLIGGDVGPFRPALPVEVPIWLAVNLRQRSKCRIVPPDWMDVDRLQVRHTGH